MNDQGNEELARDRARVYVSLTISDETRRGYTKPTNIKRTLKK
jgi:hypothetical protein